MRIIGTVGVLDNVRALGDSRPCRHLGNDEGTLKDIGTVRVIGIMGTLDTVRDDQTLREVGTVRVVGNAGTLGTVRDDQTLKFYSNVNAEESLVWVCPLNEERGFVAYIVS